MVYKRKYSYAVNAYNVPAEVVGKTLEAIEKRDGTVTKESFLEESRPEESPTHSMFEWNDEVAAEKYRLVQSRTIINNLRVEIVPNEGEDPKIVKAFVDVTDGRQREKARYINFSSALSDDKSRGIVYRNALAELRTFKRKYKGLRELEAVFAAIDELGA